MFIKISSLEDGVYDYKFDEKISEIELSEPFFGNFKLNVTLQKISNQIILDGKIKLNAKFDCDRCSTDFKTVIKSEYKQVYLFNEEHPANDDLDVTYLPTDADKIYLDKDIRDYAILAIPMKKLCKDDCKGLCPRCGADLNVESCKCNSEDFDPRWAPLQELKDKLKSN